MRALVFSHSYVVAANHAKLEHLARKPGVELSLLCPRSVRRELATYRVQRTEHPDYRIVPLRTVYPSHTYRFFYLTAGRAIARLAPDLIQIEDTLITILPQFLRQTTILIGGIALVAATSLQLTGILLLSLPVLTAAAVVFGRKTRKISREAQDLGLY